MAGGLGQVVWSRWSVTAGAECMLLLHTRPPTLPSARPPTHLPPIAPATSAQVRPPRVQESAVHMECALRHTYEIKDAQV